MSDILSEAADIIDGERLEQYGDSSDQLERIADFWSTYLQGREHLNGFDVANMMILLKISRAKAAFDEDRVFEFPRDSYVDIAGYSALAGRLADDIEKSHSELPVVYGGVKALWDLPDDPFDLSDWGRVPRVWHSASDVPMGVIVTDRDGDFQRLDLDGPKFLSKYEDEGEGWEPSVCWVDEFAPFTEVLS